MKKTFMLLALVVSGIAAWAQNADHSHVSGVVENSNGEKLVNAVVNFYSATDSLRHFPCVCDVEGYFNLEIPKGEYRYAISYMGQRFQNKDFRVNATAGSVRLRPIVVSVNETILDEVVVKANRPFVSYQGNNAVYHLAAHRGAAGGTVLDGLKFIPGMQVDGADGLSVFGFYKLTVAVNGRVLKLTDEEVKAYLATLGTADVEQIELIRNPGPEYGSLSGAVLNVVTKKKADEGINAFFSANLSYQRMLSEQANGRVNINEGKWRNFVAYNFTDRRRKEMLDTSIGCDTTVVNPQQSHLFQLGSELQIASGHFVGMRIYGTRSDEKLENTPNLLVDMDRLGAGANLYHSVSNKLLTWNVNADYAYRNSKKEYQREGVYTSGLKDVFHYLRASTDFWYKLAPAVTFQTGGGWTTSDIDTRPMEQNTGTAYKYTEKTLSAYLTLRYNDHSIDAYGGIQGNYDDWKYREHSVPDDKTRRLWVWQPYFSIGYNWAKNHRLSATFQTYYKRPDFRDLMPYISSSSTIVNRKGSTDMKNSTRYSLSLNYTFMRAAMLEVSLSSEKNPIVENIVLTGSAYHISKINLENSKYLRVVAGTPIPIITNERGLSWLATTYLAYHLQRDKGVVNNVPYSHNFNAYYVQHKQSIYLPSEWTFDAQVTYYSPLTAGLYLTEKQWWTDLTISKRVGDWKFALSGHDLFNTNIARGRVAGMDSPVYFTKNWCRPKITLGVNVALGNKKLKTSNRKNVDADSRLKQSADEGITIGENK